MQLQNRKVTVIGMGRTGVAAANFLAQKAVQTTLVDGKSRKELQSKIKGLHPAVRTRFETSSPDSDSELVVVSPGVDIHSSDLETTRCQNIEIISEIELACRFSSIPVIAVTGTNGKSTVVTLVGDILTRDGKTVRIGGNLGIPYIELIEQEPAAEYLVLEISSFQMEATYSLHPRIAVILNITPDHLDRHKTLKEYTSLKGKIADHQTADDVLVLNLDDPRTRAMGKSRKSKLVYFSMERELDEGAFIRDQKLILRFRDEELELCAVRELSPAMQWQVENVLASVAIAGVLGTGRQAMVDAIREFPGLEHRLEWVCTVEGVDFINDSKGTNVGSLTKSLSSMSRPVILIAGGKNKGGDFSSLRTLVEEKVKHLVLIGEAREAIQHALQGTVAIEDADNLEQAVRRASQSAEYGDVVLFSPACASFDMFSDYMERGRCFKTAVRKL